MVASQLIYTACGKDKTGAFGVWAKSLDITKNESDEIVKAMLYKRPSNLPYEPTQKEIEELFPKKISYFILSSGRYCLAQSTYVGRVYSDLDTRTGNYIIHACVFSDCEDILPMTFVNNDIFKRELSYEEWHDNDAPDSLPQIELSDQGSGLTKKDVDDFFTEHRLNNLKLLVQAVIDTDTTDRKVTFNDDEANLKYWYKALSLCIPKSLQKRITFCTYYTPSISAQPGMSSMSNMEVKVRNISSNVSSTVFSYSQEARSGKSVFDFSSELIPNNIVVSKYVNGIVDSLKNNLFNALMTVDAVDKLINNNGLSIDNAACLQNLKQKNMDWFENPNDLSIAIELLTSSNQEDYYDIAEKVFSYCIANDRWRIDSCLLPIYRFAFDYAENIDKTLIIKRYVENFALFGINENSSCVDFSEQVKSSAPFLWVNFVEYILENDNMTSYLSNSSSFNKKYLLFDAFAESINDIDKEQQKKCLYYFVELTSSSIKNECIENVRALLTCIRKYGSKWESWLINQSLSNLLKDQKRISEVCRIAFLMDLIEAMGDDSISEAILKQLIIENSDDYSFVDDYIERVERNTKVYYRLENSLINDENCAAFFDNKNIILFSKLRSVTHIDLKKYYDAYYLRGKDKGAFKQKIIAFINQYNGEQKIEECLKVYTEWFGGIDDSFADAIDIINAIGRTAFAVDMSFVISFAEKNGIDSFHPILKRLKQNNYEIPRSYFVMRTGLEIRMFLSKHDNRRNLDFKKDFIKQVKSGTNYSLLTDTRMIQQFVETFITDVVSLYLEIADENNFEQIIVGCFELISSSPSFCEVLCSAIVELDKKDEIVFITDLIAYAYNIASPFSSRLKKVIDCYLDKIGRSKRKRVLLAVCENVSDDYEKKVKKFIEQYTKEHESFLERIVGGFGKNDDGNDDDDDKKRPSKKQWKK